MHLAHDLLLIDIEPANPDPDRGSFLQLSAVLLDSSNLLEKNNFNMFARPSFADGSAKSLAKRAGLSEDDLLKSKRQPDVLHDFFMHFRRDAYQLASFGYPPFSIFYLACKKAGFKEGVVMPLFDAWTPLYLHYARHGVKKLPNLETMADLQKVSIKSPFSAMDRVRAVAELLRKL